MDKISFSYVVINSNGIPMTNIRVSNRPTYELKEDAIKDFLNKSVFYFFRRKHWWNYYQWAGYKIVKVKIELLVD